MTANQVCRYCGQPTDVPQISKGEAQRILRYIWQNPRCSKGDIAKEFVATKRVSSRGSLDVFLSKIKKDLEAFGYALVAYVDPRLKRVNDGTRPKRYYIKPPVRTEKTDTIASQPKEPTNGTIDLNTSVSRL